MTTLQQNHADMVATLAKDGGDIIMGLSPHSAHLLHMAVGVAGEGGELLDAIKKYAIYEKELDKDNVIEELGDIEFYLEGIRSRLNITREQTLVANMEKLHKRYNEKKYTNKAAQDRADKI